MKPLWIISGFLGSGKTTVLNSLIASAAPRAVAVLVNDFGEISVDRSLLRVRAGVQVVDLNGGQIFCSCISGSFVDRIAELAATPAEMILVESSGMAKPGALGPILHEARKRSPERFHYAGMVTVVEAPRFLKLRQVVNAVDEQVVYADLLVINKRDLVETDEAQAVADELTRLNGAARILEATRGAVGIADLPGEPAGPAQRVGPGGEHYRGWNGGKPRCHTWIPQESSARSLEDAVLRRLQGGALRIKGYATDRGVTVLVNAAGDSIEITPAIQPENTPLGLTVFEPAQ